MCDIMNEMNERAVKKATEMKNRESIIEMLKDGVDKKKILKYLHISEEEFDRLLLPVAG